MELRVEFVALASQAGANVSELCRRYGISRKTGYKWLKRGGAGGEEALADRSRRPCQSPHRTSAEVEARVVELRDAHPAWGGRKLRARLHALGVAAVPSASTITAILRRHQRLEPAETAKHTPYRRFEHAAPNELWQVDFKGHLPLARSAGRCHPLTLLDDHSRFNLLLAACPDEQSPTVQAHLTTVFRRYGLPRRLLMDNGSPWGSDADHPWTPLTVWLLQLGISVTHGRPYHPQTQGKEERFHRTLLAEAIGGRRFADLAEAQRHFDAFRLVYNHERPHEALGLAVPASRFQPSRVPFPETLPPVEYGPDDQVRLVQQQGLFTFRGHTLRVAAAFRGLPIALRPTAEDGRWLIVFRHQRLAQVDLRDVGARR